MKVKISLIIPVLMFFLFPSIQAQDLIIKRNQDTIYCDIKEMGTESVKYLLPDYPDDVLFAVDNDKVLKVIFENGQEKIFMTEMENPENYSDNCKNAIKFDFLSPLTGNLTFTYERSLKPGASFEGTLGIIGLGVNVGNRHARGTFFKFGYKFIKSPDFYFNKMRYAHILKGGYVKPELSAGYYTQDYFEYQSGTSLNNREEIFSFCIHLVLGKQWVFNNVFLVDFSVGIGYGFDSTGDGGYHFGYANSESTVPISGTAGLRIGYLFK
jgi:hypothetical protein